MASTSTFTQLLSSKVSIHLNDFGYHNVCWCEQCSGCSEPEQCSGCSEPEQCSGCSELVWPSGNIKALGWSLGRRTSFRIRFGSPLCLQKL